MPNNARTRGAAANGAQRVLVASTAMLAFISFWQAAAVVLNDMGSSAFYAGAIAEHFVGKTAPWFILAIMLVSYVWELPLRAALGGHGPKSLLNGWQLSGTFFAHTGFPYTVVDPQKSLELASKNYFGWIYAVHVGRLGTQPPCGAGAAYAFGSTTALPAGRASLSAD